MHHAHDAMHYYDAMPYYDVTHMISEKEKKINDPRFC